MLGFSEDDHPRDSDGKFTSGGGSSDEDAEKLTQDLAGAYLNADVKVDIPDPMLIRPGEQATPEQRERAIDATRGAVGSLVALAERYPEVADTITSIDIGPNATGTAAGSFSATASFMVDLNVNPLVGVTTGNLSIVGATVNESTPDSYAWTGGAIATHEFGHALDFTSAHASKEEISDAYSGDGPDLFVAAQERWDADDRSHISDYAQTNVAEYFAEAFTAREIGREDVLSDGDMEMLSATESRLNPEGIAASGYVYEGVSIEDDFDGSIIAEGPPDVQASAAPLRRLVLEYDEDKHQRDDRGRFATTGGTKDAVEGLMERARAVEPAVSADLQAIADAHGGQLLGYDFRLKSESSLERKVGDKTREGMTREQAAGAIKDSLRYTVGLDPDRYTDGVSGALTTLESKGYEITEAKNYWQPGDPYSGLNMVAQHPDGHVFELQFHTPDSYAMKEHDNHVLYERYRAADTPVAERRELYATMAQKWDDVVVPTGVMAIGTPIYEEAP